MEAILVIGGKYWRGLGLVGRANRTEKKQHIGSDLHIGSTESILTNFIQ